LSKCSPHTAAELVDSIVRLSVTDDNVSSEDIKELVHLMSRSRIKGKITLFFNEHGQIHPEVTITGDSAVKYFTERKV